MRDQENVLSFPALFDLPSGDEHAWYARPDPLPDIPIMPATRLQLELLLQEPVLDLRAVSEVILEDLGATLQIFRLVGEEYAVEDERPMRIEDCIASLNRDSWFEAVCAATAVQNSRVLSAWQHAKRIGYCAEQLAADEESVRPGEAHLVGLLHEVGKLPELLGWQSGETAVQDQALGAMLAEHWHLPHCVLAATQAQQQPAGLSVWPSLLEAAHARVQHEEVQTFAAAQSAASVA